MTPCARSSVARPASVPPKPSRSDQSPHARSQPSSRVTCRARASRASIDGTCARTRSAVIAEKKVFQLHHPRGNADGGRLRGARGIAPTHAKGDATSAGARIHEPVCAAPPARSATVSSEVTPVETCTCHCVDGRSATRAVHRSYGGSAHTERPPALQATSPRKYPTPGASPDTSPGALGHARRPCASRGRSVPAGSAREPVNDQLCAPSRVTRVSAGSDATRDRSITPRSAPAPSTRHERRTAGRAGSTAATDTARDHPSALRPLTAFVPASGARVMSARARSVPSARRSTTSKPGRATPPVSMRSCPSTPRVTRKPGAAVSTGGASGAASKGASAGARASVVASEAASARASTAVASTGAGLASVQPAVNAAARSSQVPGSRMARA